MFTPTGFVLLGIKNKIIIIIIRQFIRRRNMPESLQGRLKMKTSHLSTLKSEKINPVSRPGSGSFPKSNSFVPGPYLIYPPNFMKIGPQPQINKQKQTDRQTDKLTKVRTLPSSSAEVMIMIILIIMALPGGETDTRDRKTESQHHR